MNFNGLDRAQYYGITEFIYQEVIQGALSEKDFTSLVDYLVAQTFFYPMGLSACQLITPIPRGKTMKLFSHLG